MTKDTQENQQIDHRFTSRMERMIHEEYHYLKPNEINLNKKSFFNKGKIDFVYNDAKKINLTIYKDELKNITADIISSDLPEVVKKLYLDKFTEQGHITKILEAASVGDDEALHRASVELYGAPNSQLYWFTVDQINTRFKSLINKIDPKRKTLHKAFSVWQNYYTSLDKPAKISVHHVPYYEGIYIPDDYEVDSADKIHQMFVAYLEKNNLTNWTVMVDLPGERVAFGVNQATKTISIPHDSDLALRKDTITKRSLKALLVHEIGVHVLRRENGERSPLYLLGIGLDNYLRAEEGIATFAEQLIVGADSYAGETGYLAIGAAMGTLGRALDFNNLFTLLHAYYILLIADKQLDEQGFYELDELRMLAVDKAWSRTLRTYRGTTGQKAGAVYTRDIIYLEGNRRIWKLIDTEPEVKPEWLIGKYDPTNLNHINALKELGILSEA